MPAESLGELRWEVGAAKVTTERGAMVGESPGSGTSAGDVPKKTRSDKRAALLERLKEEKRRAEMLQTSVQPQNSFEIQRWEDLTNSCTRDPAGVKFVTASEGGPRELAGSAEDA